MGNPGDRLKPSTSTHQGRSFRWGVRDRNGDCEGGSTAWGGFDCKFALEQFSEFPADGKSQPSSGELSRMAGVCLPEFLEYQVLHVRCDSRSCVRDTEKNMFAGSFGLEGYLALVGCELDGIRHEVVEDLLKPIRVCCHHKHVIIGDIQCDGDSSFFCLKAHSVNYVRDRFRTGQIDRINRNFAAR